MKKIPTIWWVVIVAVIIIIIAVALLKGLSGEDDWICKDGQWQKHGNPSSAAPSTACPVK